MIDKAFELGIDSLQIAFRISTFFSYTTLCCDYRAIGLVVHECSIVFGQFEFLCLFRLEETIGYKLMPVLVQEKATGIVSTVGAYKYILEFLALHDFSSPLSLLYYGDHLKTVLRFEATEVYYVRKWQFLLSYMCHNFLLELGVLSIGQAMFNDIRCSLNYF